MSSPRGVSIFYDQSLTAAFQRPAPEPLYPLVPSEFAPLDMLVYSVNRPTSTGEAPSVVQPAVQQSGSPPEPPASGLLRPLTLCEVWRVLLAHCSIAVPASPQPAESSSWYRARSVTISCT